MELLVNACVLLTTIGVFAYLGFVILSPERF